MVGERLPYARAGPGPNCLIGESVAGPLDAILADVQVPGVTEVDGLVDQGWRSAGTTPKLPLELEL